MSLEQLTDLIEQMTPQDAVRAEEMLTAIASHDWDSANGLIISWSVADMPDWDEIVEDPFDGGWRRSKVRVISYNLMLKPLLYMAYSYSMLFLSSLQICDVSISFINQLG